MVEFQFVAIIIAIDNFEKFNSDMNFQIVPIPGRASSPGEKPTRFSSGRTSETPAIVIVNLHIKAL